MTTATVGKGKYSYRLVEKWAKLPSGETFGMVSAMATDSQDRLYVFQRKDPPVVIFDRDGKSEKSAPFDFLASLTCFCKCEVFFV